MLDEDLYDREFVRTWVDWRGYLRAERPDLAVTFDNFIVALKELYAQFTPEFAAEETGVDRDEIVEAARAIGRARGRFSTHNWRSAAAGNLWGWQITRCLYLLVVLTGSVGTKGGVGLHLSNKFVPEHPDHAAAARILERAALSARVPARLLRDELPAAASPQGESRQARRLLHARLQPGLDQPRRLLVDRDADRHATRSASTSR